MVNFLKILLFKKGVTHPYIYIYIYTYMYIYSIYIYIEREGNHGEKTYIFRWKIFSDSRLCQFILYIYIPVSSHTSAPSYDPILTSKLLLCFLIHGFPSFCKTDFIVWKLFLYLWLLLSHVASQILKPHLGNLLSWRGRSPLCRTLEICMNYPFNFLNHLITFAVFFHSFTYIQYLT